MIRKNDAPCSCRGARRASSIVRLGVARMGVPLPGVGEGSVGHRQARAASEADEHGFLELGERT